MPSPLFSATIAGSLPKPAWLSETQKLWPQWKAEGAELAQAKADATLLWIKAQEDAGLDVIGDGEQSRQHFVHGFLEQVEDMVVITWTHDPQARRRSYELLARELCATPA